MKTVEDYKKQHIKTLLKMFLNEDKYCKSTQEADYNIEKYTDVIFDITNVYEDKIESIPIGEESINEEVNGYRQALIDYANAIREMKANQ